MTAIVPIATAVVVLAAAITAFVYRSKLKTAATKAENIKSAAEADVKRAVADGKSKLDAVKNELRKHVDALEASAAKDEHAAKADVAEVAKKIKGLL